MEFRLSKTQARELVDRRAQLATLRELIEAEFETLATALDGIVAPLNDLIHRYNDALAEVRTLAERVSGWRSVYDDRSARWQESDPGQAALAFVEAWENCAPDDVDGGWIAVSLSRNGRQMLELYGDDSLALYPSSSNVAHVGMVRR